MIAGKQTDSLRGANILIVDDQQTNLDIFALMLNSYNYNVRTVVSGQEALAEVAKEIPDLILLDIMMQGMNGFEVCTYLKSNQATCDIPIIFITGLHSLQDRIQAFNLGGVDYITKPFHPTEVVAYPNTSQAQTAV